MVHRHTTSSRNRRGSPAVSRDISRVGRGVLVVARTVISNRRGRRLLAIDRSACTSRGRVAEAARRWFISREITTLVPPSLVAVSGLGHQTASSTRDTRNLNDSRTAIIPCCSILVHRKSDERTLCLTSMSCCKSIKHVYIARGGWLMN
jgi:hypothetical protein